MQDTPSSWIDASGSASAKLLLLLQSLALLTWQSLYDYGPPSNLKMRTRQRPTNRDAVWYCVADSKDAGVSRAGIGSEYC
jgi:hypothetical protein